VVHVEGTKTQVLLDLVKKKASLFLNVDRSFLVEVACMEAMLGQQGDNIMEQKIEECFPTEAQLCTLGETHTRLEALRAGPITQVTGSSAAQTLAAVLEITSGMKRGETPQRQFLTSTFMRKLQPKLDLFCQYTAMKDGKSVVLTGKPACQAKLQDLIKKASMETITFKDLEEIHLYEWLVQGQVNRDKLKEMVESLLQVAKVSAKDSGKRRSTKGATDATQTKNSGASSSTESGALADVMALFS
jgi:hypothetical protein